MARSDAEIRLILRKLLSGEDNRSGFIGKAFGCLGLVVAVFVLFLGIGIAATAKIDDAVVFWVAVVPAVIGWYLFRSLGKQLNKRRGGHLVKEFKTYFQEGSEDFERAVQLLNMAKSDTGVEKRLLDALGMDIQFEGTETGEPPKAVHNAFDDVFDQMPISGSPSMTKKMLDLMKKAGKTSGDYEESSWTDENGTYTTVKYKKVFPHDPSQNVSGTSAGDGLLGDFEQPTASGSNDDSDAKNPKPSPTEEEASPDAAPFLPLDPYARSGKRKNEDENE